MTEPTEQVTPSNRKACWAAVVGLAVVGAVVWASGLDGAFVLDDLSSIVDNPRIRDWASLWQGLGQTRRPLLELTLAINYTLAQAWGGDGLNPLGYHLFNIAVHVAAGLMLFALLRQLLRTRGDTSLLGRWADGLAGAAALLWLVHPLNTQAVTYVVQRGESMMGLFYLAALAALVRGGRAQAALEAGEPGRLERHAAGWYALAVAAGVAAMATKEVAVTLPVVALLIDRAFLSGSWVAALRQRWGLYLALALPAAVLTAWTLMGPAQEQQSAGLGMTLHTPAVYAMNQPAVILHYLRLAACPVGLTLDYGWRPAAAWTQLVPAWLVVGTLLALTAWGVWRNTAWGCAAGAFFVILAPTSSIVPIADLAVEHRMYLPLAAVVSLAVPLVGLGLARLMPLERAGRIGMIVALIAAAGLAVQTVARNRDYASDEMLWRDTIARAPDNPRAWSNLGVVLYRQGRVEEAIAAWQRGVMLPMGVGNRDQLWENLAAALGRIGRAQQGVAIYRQAQQAGLAHPPALLVLGAQLARAGQVEQAEALFAEAVEQADESRYPGLRGVAWADRAKALYQLGRLEQAAEAFEQAVRLNQGGDASLRNLYGITLAQLGRMEEAVAQFRAALRINPTFTDAQANLERALRMSR